MKTLTQFLITLLAIAFASATLAAASPVGATPGGFAVSPSGAATYSIPIQVPPGVGGMQPSLSLSYNSQGGNGIAGVGWGIGGLSAITRCGATIDRDGSKGGVDLTTSDKYCLDGQRLIDMNLYSLTSCTNGREFRTEIESFNRVVSCGTQGNGPMYFTVTSKNGVTTEYGNGNGSQQFVQGNSTTVLNWHVSTIKDVVGNSMQFVYNTDSATSGEHRIDHIDYTYNGTAFVGGVARSVKFNYGSRTDVETSYVGGVVKTSQRLADYSKDILPAVRITVGSSLVREYRLGYDTSVATGRSRLASMQECGSDSVCFPATKIVAQETAIGPQNWTWAAHGVGADGWQLADLFGDGRQVYYTHTAGNHYASRLNSDGTVQNWTWAAHGVGADGWQLADLFGDGRQVYYTHTAGNHYATRFSSFKPDLLTSVATGLNAQTTLTYKPLTDSSVYTKDPDSSVTYPVKNVQEPLYVVSAVSSSNGLVGFNTANYSYTGMKEHQTGRGNLGFHTMTMIGADGIKSVTTNNQIFPYVGMAERVDVYQSNGTTLLSSSVNTFKCLSSSNPALCAPPAYSATASYGSTLYLPFVSSSTSYSWDLNGTALPTSASTVNTLDAYGNTLSATAASSDGFSRTSTSVFFNDATNWRLGLPVKTSVTSTVPAAFSDTGATVTSPVARTTMYVYQLGVGTWNYQLKDEVVQPATDTATGTTYAPTYTLSTDSLVTTHAYDLTYGYQNKVTVSGTGVTARSTSTTMDFVNNTVSTTVTANVLQKVNNVYVFPPNKLVTQTQIQTIDPKFGVPVKMQGPNQIGTALSTQWFYDGFGRKVKELRADGTATTTSLTDHGSAGLHLSVDIGSARYSSTTQVLNTSGTDMAPPVKVYYDMLGRELRSETQGFNTATIYKDTAYDSLGRVKKASRPYFSSNTVYWTTPAYDALGRTYNVTTPDGAISSTTFNGFTTTMIAPTSGDGLTRKRTEVKNSQGQVVSVTDALNGVITYKYDAFGNLGKVTTTGADGKTATITSTFDIRGRKTAMTDPDMGAWTYTYNVFGDLLTQKDAKLQTATMEYDELGRMYKRVEAEGTSTWEYDTAGNGKGKLANVATPQTNNYARSYVYDSLSRPKIVGTSINGVLYNMGVDYDPVTGRVTNVQFPSTVTGFGNFAFYNNYDTRGFLTAVSSLANNGGTKYWQLDANGIDAEGRVISETMGNSTQTKRTYNPISDLLSDIDTTGPSGVVQDSNYTYYTGVPNLNTRSSYVAGSNYTETFTYDALNRVLSANITGGASKSFAYDSLGNITAKTGVGDYTYGSATVRPHAVASISVSGVVKSSYTYDANGNQTIGAGRTLGYTSFNLPKSVTMAAISQSYAYDAEHQRIVMTEGSANTTIYINPRWDAGTHFEKEKKGNIDEYKHYIYAGGRPVAMYVVKRDNGTGINSSYTRYLHTDHLGSVDTITSETGAIVERLSYDTWGKRRNANGSDSATQLTSTVDHHGYTGHEMNDSIGLINMNGRWYDPTLGRFMHSDPLIQASLDLQSYNRYAYVMNNPLSFTDPSGYATLFSKRKWKKITGDLLRDISKATIEINIPGAYQQRYRVGEILTVIALSGTLGYAYGWSNNDWKTVGRAHATVGVMALAYLAMPGVPVNPTWATAGMYVGQSAAVGYAGSNATARIWGASASEAHSAGLDSARHAAVMAGARVGYQAMVGWDADPNPGETDPNNTTYDADEFPSGPKGKNVSGFNTRTLGQPPGTWEQGGTVSRVVNAFPGGAAVSHLHDLWGNLYPTAYDSILVNVGAMVVATPITYLALIPAPLTIAPSIKVTY